MQNNEFQSGVFQWLSTGAAALIQTLPSGSGICRLVNVPADKSSIAYVSTKPGSFKMSGDKGNWYTQNFKIAASEVHQSGECVYEVSRLSQDTPVANMHRLPQPFLDAIYEDRDLPLVSYDKSHIVLSGLGQFLSTNAVSGAYFPSRREDGGCLVINPSGVSIDILYTGVQPPPNALLDSL